jgi:hypothetical protein
MFLQNVDTQIIPSKHVQSDRRPFLGRLIYTYLPLSLFLPHYYLFVLLGRSRGRIKNRHHSACQLYEMLLLYTPAFHHAWKIKISVLELELQEYAIAAWRRCIIGTRNPHTDRQLRYSVILALYVAFVVLYYLALGKLRNNIILNFCRTPTPASASVVSCQLVVDPLIISGTPCMESSTLTHWWIYKACDM